MCLYALHVDNKWVFFMLTGTGESGKVTNGTLARSIGPDSMANLTPEVGRFDDYDPGTILVFTSTLHCRLAISTSLLLDNLFAL